MDLSWQDVLMRELRCEAIATMLRLERGWSESRDACLPRFGPSDGGKSLHPALCVIDDDLDYKDAEIANLALEDFLLDPSASGAPFI